jgi:hypothetical protein
LALSFPYQTSKRIISPFNTRCKKGETSLLFVRKKETKRSNLHQTFYGNAQEYGTVNLHLKKNRNHGSLKKWIEYNNILGVESD